MKNLEKYKIILFVMLLSFNETVGQGDSLIEMSLDKSIRYGKLKNGFKYYIKPISGPGTAIYLNLYVKAGMNHEDPDQSNLGHFLEHIAFETSENFPKGIYNELNLLNDLGISQFDLNGHSGNNLTEYSLLASSQNMKSVDLGLLWFEDIANRGLKITDKDIEKERGGFIQEYITGGEDDVHESFLENQLMYKLFPGTHDMQNFYEHLENFKPEVLKRYYKDWYRPELTAISIVGNIKNVDSLEREIVRRFSKIPIQKRKRKVKNIDSIFFNQPPQFGIVERDFDTVGSPNQAHEFHLYFRDNKTSQELNTMEGVKRLVKWQILTDILNSRFNSKTKVYNNKYEMKAHYTYENSEIPTSLKVLIQSRPNIDLEGLKKTIETFKQLQEHGVSLGEFQLSCQQQYNYLHLDKENPNYWKGEIKSHFVDGEALPSGKLSLLKKWLSTFTQGNFNNFIQTINLKMPQDIGVIVPAGSSHKVQEEYIREVIKNTFSKETAPFSPPFVPKELLTVEEKRKLKPKKFKDIGVGESGAKELLLENGIKIVLKSFQPVGNNKDKIFLHGFTPLGALAFPEQDYFSAVNAPEFVKNSGIGKFDKFELQRFLSDQSIFWNGIYLYTNNLESGIKMSSSLKDFEVMLELIYLYFMEPKVTDVAFKDWKRSHVEFHRNPPGDIKSHDLNTLVKQTLKDNSGVLFGTARSKGVNNTSMERGYKIYNKIFKKNRNFTFIISGDFHIDSVTPHIIKYIGNLTPPQLEMEVDKENNVDIPLFPGPVSGEFKFPGHYKKMNYLYKPYFIKEAAKTFDWKEALKIEALGAVTNTKVWNLRFDKGYSLYAPGAGTEFNGVENQFEINGYFDCDPAEFPMLKEEFQTIYKSLGSNLITKDLLDKSLVRMLLFSDPKGMGNSQRVVQEKLYSHHRFNLPWTETKEIYNFIKTLTPKDILETAKKYYVQENLYEFVLKPNLEKI